MIRTDAVRLAAARPGRRAAAGALIAACIALVAASVALGVSACVAGGGSGGRRGVLVRPGVTLDGQVVGGFDAAALHRLVVSLAAERDVRPVNAAVDPRDQSAVPGLPGWKVDVEATEKAVMEARPRQAVDLVIRSVPPEVGLDHFAGLPI